MSNLSKNSITHWLAFHGNPGHPSDWRAVEGLVLNFPQIKFQAVPSFDLQWREKIKNHHGKINIVAHSMGCLMALKAAREFAGKVDRLVLVNPYVVPEKPLAGLAKTLVSTPVVGSLLLKQIHKKNWVSSFREMTYPHDESQFASLFAKREQLSDPANFIQAAADKISFEHTLTEIVDLPAQTLVLWGDQDKTGTACIQLKALKKYSSVTIKMIPGHGHALPWTAPQEVISALTQEPDKIGYEHGESEKNNVTQYMQKHVSNHPNKKALRWAKRDALSSWSGKAQDTFEHEDIDFEKFNQRIGAFANGLASIGIGKGDRVIVFLPMSLDMYVTMFAVQKLGAIAVFLDSWARHSHLGASAECVSPKAMISFEMAFELVSQVPEFSSMPLRILYGPGKQGTHQFHNLLEAGSKMPVSKATAVESEFTALITFTTGSTGKPKGANRTHRFLSAQHQALSHVIPYNEDDVDMPAFPIFSLNNLASGVTTVLPALDLARPSEKDSAILVSQILNQKVNCTTLSPSMLNGVSKYCNENKVVLSGLRRVVTGGAPISKDDVKNFLAIAPQTDLWVLYGSTEAEPMAHIEGHEMISLPEPNDPEVVEEGVCVGHISEDIDYKFIKIIDGPIDFKKTSWKELEVARGEVGEFICTGDHVCRDYYNNPDAFLSTKIQDEHGRVWHRTGDLCYFDDKHRLWMVGRVNNAVARQGKYYFPVRAEVVMKRLDFVYRCAFLGIDGKTALAIELKKDLSAESFNFANAKKEIHRVFEKNHIPVDQIYFVKTIPMDPRHHSKVEYKVLRESVLKTPQEIIHQ